MEKVVGVRRKVGVAPRLAKAQPESPGNAYTRAEAEAYLADRVLRDETRPGHPAITRPRPLRGEPIMGHLKQQPDAVPLVSEDFPAYAHQCLKEVGEGLWVGPVERESIDWSVEVARREAALLEGELGERFLETRTGDLLMTSLCSGFRRNPEYKPQRFNWLPSDCRPGSSQVESLNQVLTLEAVNQALGAGLAYVTNLLHCDNPPYSPLNLFNLRYSSLSKEGSEALSGRIKEVGAALFAGPCWDLVNALKGLDEQCLNHAEQDLIGTTPELKSDVDFQNSQQVGIDRLAGDPSHYGFVRTNRFVESRPSEGDARYFQGGSINRVPVGDYGEPLAFALVKAAQIAGGLAEKVGRSMDEDTVQGQVLGKLTFVEKGEDLMREGVFTIAQTLALILAKAPPGKELNSLLDEVADSGLVGKLAAVAPFGVVAPLATGGWLPSDSVRTCPATGKAYLPQSLTDLCRDARENRELPSAEGHSRYVHFAGEWKSLHRTETLKGCPVASLGIRYNAQGELEVPKDTPLNCLAKEYIHLVKRMLIEEGGLIPVKESRT